MLPLPQGDTTLGLPPLHLLHPIPGHPRGPRCLSETRRRAQESLRARDLSSHSHHPIRALLEPPHLDLSPASIIRRLFFHYIFIPGNVDCSARDLHGEVRYDLPAFAEDPELRESMLLVQRYSLEPFMTPRPFFYPRVVIEFYHTMTSRCEPSPKSSLDQGYFEPQT